MQMLKITPLPNGAHDNQTYHGFLPDGWALIPEGMELENFPFGDIEAAEINGAMTVTGWTPGVVPEPEEPEPTPEPTLEERVTTLETTKAEQSDVEALAAAIERGMSL